MLYNARDIRIIPFSAYRPGGEIGRRRGLKIPRRKVCRFESDPGHQIPNPNLFSWIRVFSWLNAQKSVIHNTPAGLLWYTFT